MTVRKRRWNTEDVNEKLHRATDEVSGVKAVGRHFLWKKKPKLFFLSYAKKKNVLERLGKDLSIYIIRCCV